MKNVEQHIPSERVELLADNRRHFILTKARSDAVFKILQDYVFNDVYPIGLNEQVAYSHFNKQCKRKDFDPSTAAYYLTLFKNKTADGTLQMIPFIMSILNTIHHKGNDIYLYEPRIDHYELYRDGSVSKIGLAFKAFNFIRPDGTIYRDAEEHQVIFRRDHGHAVLWAITIMKVFKKAPF